MEKIILFLLILFIYGCNNPEKNIQVENQQTDTSTSEVDTILEVVNTDNPELIKIVENIFFKNIKQYDLENGTNRHSQFKELLKKHQIHPYDLYLQLTEIHKMAEEEARKEGVEIKANGRERITEKYYIVLRSIKDSKIPEFQEKYNLTNTLLHQFQNNYCFCYSGKNANYCKNGNCLLINGQYWK